MRSTATITRQEDGWLVSKDMTQLSHVALDPRVLVFPYMDMIGDLIDQMKEGPLRVIHIGGGGLTLPRYVAAKRPGSDNVVSEVDAGLLKLVEERLPWPPDFNIWLWFMDGRSTLRDTADGTQDLIIADAFIGFETPDDLKTTEAFEEMWRVLKPGGLLISNVILGEDEYIETAGAVFGSALIFTIGEQDWPIKNTIVAMYKHEDLP